MSNVSLLEAVKIQARAIIPVVKALEIELGKDRAPSARRRRHRRVVGRIHRLPPNPPIHIPAMLVVDSISPWKVSSFASPPRSTRST